MAGATRIELISTVLETAILTIVLRPYALVLKDYNIKNKPRGAYFSVSFP